MLKGLLAGAAFYCATALPVAAITGAHGDIWAGAVTLYGVVCGSVGVMLAE